MRNQFGMRHGQAQEATKATVELTEEQVESLVFMYQEEKMAGDVYSVFAEEYDAPIFEQIAASEDKHASAVENLLVQAGVDTSALDALEPGEFQNEELQALYDALIEQGSTSYESALEAGVAIEETDIADLSVYLQESEMTDAMVNVYEHLSDGSENHLDAFTTQLETLSA